MSDTAASFIEVADATRAAMLLANSNDATAWQVSVADRPAIYGLLHQALTETLMLHFQATLPAPFRRTALACATEVVDVMIDSGEGVAYALAYFDKHGFVMTDPLARGIPAE